MAGPELVNQDADHDTRGNRHGDVKYHQCLDLLCSQIKRLLDHCQHGRVTKPDDKSQEKREPGEMQCPDLGVSDVE